MMHAVSARLGRLLADAPGRLAQLQVGDPAEVLDLLAETEERPGLVHRHETVARAAGDEQPDRVRPDVDDPDPHHADSPEHIGCRNLYLALAAAARRRAALRMSMTWPGFARSPFFVPIRFQIPSEPSSQADALSSSSASIVDPSLLQSRRSSTGTTSSSRLSRFRGMRSALPMK